VTPETIPFIDLRPGDDDAALRAAIDRVMTSGWFVLGPEVEAFEAEFAAASGAAHAVGVGTGTDAIALLLRAAGVKDDDEVIVPAMTAGYTALAVFLAGATPVVVDVDHDTLTINADACEAAITGRTVAIVPVHLYGQPADMQALQAIAARRSLAIVEDCCQAHLATCAGAPVGTRSAGGAFSFYPTKNLGALGDGGAVITNDASIAARIRQLRNGGQKNRYVHTEAGVNSRLDELQAAVLRARLPMLPRWTARRRALAAAYRRLLTTEASQEAGGLPAREQIRGIRPLRQRDDGHVYHLFVVRASERDALRAHLAASGIETMIHYPVPLTRQPAFATGTRDRLPDGRTTSTSDCPVAHQAAEEILSLPLHHRLADTDVERICSAVNAFSVARITRKGHILA
jgi:dTDP-3-amino-3,4,6-trideoxy-alpha-D-glucose transaminase